MSENILRLISVDAEFLPSQSIMDSALKLLRQAFPNATAINTTITEDVRFIDPGSNFERIMCPNCGKVIDIAWWQEAMDQAYKNGFRDLEIKLPCCGVISSLNNLNYEQPAGFARFVLGIRNPGKDLDESLQRSLEDLLNTKVRVIWALY